MPMRLRRKLNVNPSESQAPTSPVDQAGDAQADEAGPGPKVLRVVCDDCQQDIGAVQTKTRKLRKGFSEIGLSCPHCGFWVHSYYSTPQLEQAEKVLANFKAHQARSPQDRRRYEQRIQVFLRQREKVQRKARSLLKISS